MNNPENKNVEGAGGNDDRNFVSQPSLLLKNSGNTMFNRV
jgi:hypothetical protein